MQIRESNDNDKARIREVHRNAFGDSEGESVSQLAVDLLADASGMPVLSLVAERDGELVGSIIFSSVQVEGDQAVSAYILAPLAVATSDQGLGIGTGLINRGLSLLRERGADIVLVLGDPAYYSRTGFKPRHLIKPPYNLDYPEAWMAQELSAGALAKVSGTVRCATSLMAPKHW